MTGTMRSSAWSGWFVALAAWLALPAVDSLRAAERPPIAGASAKPSDDRAGAPTTDEPSNDPRPTSRRRRPLPPPEETPPSTPPNHEPDADDAAHPSDASDETKLSDEGSADEAATGDAAESPADDEASADDADATPEMADDLDEGSSDASAADSAAATSDDEPDLSDEQPHALPPVEDEDDSGELPQSQRGPAPPLASEPLRRTPEPRRVPELPPRRPARPPAAGGRQAIIRDIPLHLGPSGPGDAVESSSTPTLDELLQAPRPVVDPAKFKGVQPGQSNLDELTRAWGPPKSVKKNGSSFEHLYELKPFRKTVVNVADDRVRSIAITLARPHSAKELAKQLGIDEVESVLVYDDAGQLLGQAFPERGVLFVLVDDDSQSRVAQMLLEPIDPQSFALRAEERAATRTAQALADVDFALELNPRLPRAHAVRAQVLLAAGDLRGARAACEAALKYERAPEYRLTLARICLGLADPAGAIEECRRVVDAAAARPLVKAWAYQLWGEAVGASPDRDFQQAIRHHQQAIKMAEQLAVDRQTPLRRSAKQLLLDAHLGVATDIAWGNWQQKATVVPKWLERAHAIAEDIVASEAGGDEVRFQVAVGALATLGGMSEPLEATLWLDRALKHGRKLLEAEQDPVRKARVSWQLGLALADAATVEHVRRQHQLAVEHAKQAIDYLNAGQVTSLDWPLREFVVGKLLYRVGAIHAIAKNDHHEALSWYERAAPLLENPVPPCALADPGRHGEMFVSMAVSHWEVGNRSEAMRLTEQGLRLMEQGVAAGLLDRAALGVPYENLAGMHEALGDAERSKYFAGLAKSAGQSQPR